MVYKLIFEGEKDTQIPETSYRIKVSAKIALHFALQLQIQKSYPPSWYQWPDYAKKPETIKNND